MKKNNILIVLICLISNFMFSQTTISEENIDAASGNGYETLLTNVEPNYPDISISGYLQRMDMYEDEYKFSDTETYRIFKKKTLIGKEKQTEVKYKMSIRPVKGYKYGISDKVEIWGDKEKVIQFFVGFWSRKVDFADVKKGEVATTRFLTDVASISFIDENTAKITVVTAKDR